MKKFVLKPNLPSGKVAGIICGTKDARILDFFSKNEIDVLSVAANRSIDPFVSTHADMAALHLGGKQILIDKAQKKLGKALADIGFDVFETSTEIKGEYPDDIKLNFSLIGEYLIGNTKYADEKILHFTTDKTVLHVRQGYCKCSSLVVTENALITDDESIYRKSLENGIEALLVSKGDVLLEGHGYGFIGGASGKISNDTVVFFGDISQHRDSDKIIDFLSEHACGFISTDDGPLRDIGSIIPITEL